MMALLNFGVINYHNYQNFMLYKKIYKKKSCKLYVIKLNDRGGFTSL